MQLRPYQLAAKDALWNYLANRDGNPALVLPTGAGKSPLMAGIVRDAVVDAIAERGIVADTSHRRVRGGLRGLKEVA